MSTVKKAIGRESFLSKRTIIVTGGNTGLGYECAKSIAKAEKDNHIVLACRNSKRATEAAMTLIHETGNHNITFMELDLSSLHSVRTFVKELKNAEIPPLYAIVCNAGLQIVNGTQYTKDGFESTFGVNHLAHFLLVSLLIDTIVDKGRIVFVSSDTHDPAKKTGMPEPVYTNAEQLAYPDKSDKILTGTERYTTSKLCNIYCTYELSERLKLQTCKAITVNAFNPGMMPGTGLARDYSLILRLAWKYVLPILTLIRTNVNTVGKSGKELASLVTDSQFDNVAGKYFDGAKPIMSSKLSYDSENRKDLWRTSVNLVKLKQNETILSLD